jgi:hypothetical protein
VTDRFSDDLIHSDSAADPHPTEEGAAGTLLEAVGYAAKHSFSDLKCWEFERAPAKNTAGSRAGSCGTHPVRRSDAYSSMKHWGVEAGQKVGIVGFGGLGGMAAKIAKALGADVTVFTCTKKSCGNKAPRGWRNPGKGQGRLRAAQSTFDFILSTVPEKHYVNPFIQSLKRDCTLCVCGALNRRSPSTICSLPCTGSRWWAR